MANALSPEQQISLLYKLSGLTGQMSDLYTREQATPWENAEYNATAETLGVASYALQGASIGTAIAPGVGTAIGAGVGVLVGAFMGGAKRDAQLAQIRAAQDARARQIMNNIESRSKNIISAKTQFEKALSSSRYADVGAHHFKSLGVKYAYLNAQPGGVTSTLQKRALQSHTMRVSSLIEGAKVALSEKIVRYEIGLSRADNIKNDIWNNRRSGEFDTAGLNTLDALLEI